MDKLFDSIYEIMEESFPRDEIRSYEGQKELLKQSNYFLKTYVKDQKLLGFCAYYIFDEFIYIEHLACKPLSRGLGIGSKLVQDVLDEAGRRQVILEVELPVDDLTKRRIDFYERLGFKLNPYEHFQAPLNPTTGVVELKIMSSLHSLSEKQQKAYRRILNTKVYGVESEFMIFNDN